jgi:hypothetical protein
MPRPLCKDCIHLYVTWDEKFPHGCRAIAFKSKAYPIIEVRKNSGMECQFFIKKEKTALPFQA